MIDFPQPPRRILLIKPSAIGDVVHALPVLNLLRRKWPEAHIAWLVTPACAGLVEGHPQLDEVILFERIIHGKAWQSPTAAAGLFQFSRTLREKNFDLVIDLQGLFRSGWMCHKTNAPVRVGFANARELAWLFYTHRIPIETMDQHAVDRYLAVADALGCGTAPVEFHFGTNDTDRAQVRELLQSSKAYAVLMPGSNWVTKRWPVEHFAGLVDPLRNRFGLRSVVAGGWDDIGLGDKIPGALNLCGKTTLRQVVALLEGAWVVVANDSGPMHIAAALGRPLVTPYGPTNPIRTGPYGRMDTVIRLNVSCSPCYARACSHQSCLKWISPEMVLNQIGENLK